MGELPLTGAASRSTAATSAGWRPMPARARAGLCAPGPPDLPGADRRRKPAHGLRQAAARRGRQDRPGAAGLPRLQRLLDRAGGSPSGGEQQLLALARCLCGEPKLMLLDEPTEGIQPSICDEIVEALQTLRASHGIAILLVEQDIDFLCALSDRILVLERRTDRRHPDRRHQRPRDRPALRRSAILTRNPRCPFPAPLEALDQAARRIGLNLTRPRCALMPAF